MANEYRITYQGKIFLGNSVDDVVSKVKKYIETGIVPSDTRGEESKEKTKRIYQIYSEIKSSLFELRLKAEREWLEELETKKFSARGFAACEKCGEIFRVKSASRGGDGSVLCDSCIDENENKFFERECGFKQNSFFRAPYRLKPIGVDEYSDRRFWSWYNRQYSSFHAFDEGTPIYRNASIKDNEFLKWLSDRIHPLIEECRHRICATAGDASPYYELARYYCLIDQDKDAVENIDKWIDAISIK